MSTNCVNIIQFLAGDPNDQLQTLPQPMQPSPKPMLVGMRCPLRSMHGYPVPAGGKSNQSFPKIFHFVAKQNFKVFIHCKSLFPPYPTPKQQTPTNYGLLSGQTTTILPL